MPVISCSYVAHGLTRTVITHRANVWWYSDFWVVPGDLLMASINCHFVLAITLRPTLEWSLLAANEVRYPDDGQWEVVIITTVCMCVCVCALMKLLLE